MLLSRVSLLFLCVFLVQCSLGGQTTDPAIESSASHSHHEDLARPAGFWLGADLSYVNEMEDCGAQFKLQNQRMDPYELFAAEGSNLVRVRLWHNPQWTKYSNFDDVSETIQRAQQSGQQVLLDFHYSDTWADPQKQYVPAAWAHLMGDDEALADALYDYTFSVLLQLREQQRVPEFVQIGNETNAEILQLESEMDQDNINWPRNALLINHGLQAVADFNRQYNENVQRYLHIAQPENALRWFAEATPAGITDYELIGISYYEKWSTYTLDTLSEAIASLTKTYGKKVVVLETSYPWTLQNFDKANNILAEDSLAPGYPATPRGQLEYMRALINAVIAGGGTGVVYWEPAWVSTECSTLWGQGSHWENATLFDEHHNALPAMSIFKYGLLEDTLYNSDWLFYRTKEKLTLKNLARKAKWQKVSLPHTMNIEPLIVNDQWQGEGWYKKLIPFDPAWKGKNIFLKFEGAMNVADVWLNGKHLTTHYGGYLPFTVKLNPALRSGNNELLVRLNNEDNPITGPKPLEQLDFNMYGGLYRNVILQVENELYITDAVHAGIPGGGGVYVSYPTVTRESARVKVQTHVQSSRAQNAEAHKLTVEQTLFRNGHKVTSATAENIALAAGADDHVELEFDVTTPALWYPHNPNLYELHTAVYDDGKLLDEQRIKIGIREFEITREGVFINGEKLWLRGVNRHQEYPFVGYAISPQADYRDAWRIKSAGFDYVRLSHYPHSPAFMQAADELGLVLLDAIPGWQYFNEDPRFRAHVLQTCRDMIRRDRNHASVLAWECSLNESAMPESLIDEFTRIVKEELPGQTSWSAGWLEYGYDIYLQARQHRLQHYNPPAKPYIVSEYGDWEYYAMNAGLNQDQWGDLLQEERSSRQLLQYGEKRLLQQATNIQEAHNDNFATVAEGDGYWVMFDYNRGYADDLEASGIMSIDRLPKFSWYFYQSQRDPQEKSDAYASGPMVYIASYWQPDSDLNVRVFSNTEEVELLLNGESLGKQGPAQTSISHNLAHPPFIFELEKFVAGTLEARGYLNGELVASHQVATPETPYKLQMRSDFSLGGVQSSVGDLVFVYAELQNKNGLIVPESGTKVEFEVVKGAEIIGPQTVETTAGIASVLLKITDLNIAPIIHAKAKGLPPGRIHLEQ